MELLLLLLTAGLVVTTSAQFIAGNDGNDGRPSLLCNKTFANANATGIFSFDPGVAQGPQQDQPDNDSNFAQNAAWGITLYDTIGASNSTAELSAWYNTNGANYSDNAGLYYDVCVVTLNTLTHNSYYSGANDKGDCLETFDSPCVDALKEQANAFTLGLIGNPTPNPGSNLTQGSLSHVCYDIGNQIEENFPKECNKFFNGSATAYGSAMTSHNDSWLYDGCSLTDEASNATFGYTTGASLFTSTYSEEVQKIVYANFTQVVIPVLTIFLPIADIEADTTIATANAVLSCPHINHINEGSLQPYAAPSPTPVGSGSGLSGGAIAGIVIGVLAGLAIMLGALWFFWFRKRRASKKGRAIEDSDQSPPAYTADAKVAEAPYGHEQVPLVEVSGHESQIRPELPTQNSGPRIELAADNKLYKDAGGQPAELPASGLR